VIASLLNTSITFTDACTCYNARHIDRDATYFFLGRSWGCFGQTSRRKQESGDSVLQRRHYKLQTIY